MPSKTNSETTKAWRKANPDKVRQYKKAHRLKHLEESRAHARRKYRERVAKNPDFLKGEYEKYKGRIKETVKAYRMENPEKIKAWRDQYWRNRRPNNLLASVKKSAKDKGLEFDLTLDWFEARIASGVCEMSGLPFDMESKRGPNSPSVDRIDPKGPYTQANCRMILWFLNRAMSNLGEEYCLMVFGRVIEKRST